MRYLKRYERYGTLFKRVQFCRRRHSSRPEPRPFALSSHPAYLVFAWGYLPATRANGQHYLRVRRYLGQSDPSLSRGLRDREKISEILLRGHAERRQTEQDIWTHLLRSSPTHVVRFGWQTPIGHHYDIFRLPLTFGFAGYYADGLAKQFGLRLMESLERNSGLTWYLCPSTLGDTTTEAASFWLGAAIAFWLEIDMGIKSR